jgi:GDP-L-fucose synthase
MLSGRKGEMITPKVLQAFAHSNVLVTGGTGLIGREVVRMLCDSGASVKVVSLDAVTIHRGARYEIGDLTDFSVCREVSKGMDFVFHLAGIKGSIEVTKTKPASFFVPLLMMNTNLLEACRVNKVRKVVYTSSIGAYANAEVFSEKDDNSGPPMDMFPGWAKRMAELQIQAYRIQYGSENFAVVRPCNVYGPGDNFDPKNAMVIPTLMYRIHCRENPIVVWGDGSAIRDFAFSRDVAEGVILALYHGTGKYPFLNLGSGHGFTIRQLVEALSTFLDFKYVFDSTKSAGFPKRVMDISLARELIGYNPTTSLQDGLKATWEWFQANAEEYRKKKNYFSEPEDHRSATERKAATC